ncbi:MAG: hypothetical protein LC792_05715, partial [Actinobacteria bacterium]|nr:hypothetical protein [Actinomycetota bacterium]
VTPTVVPPPGVGSGGATEEPPLAGEAPPAPAVAVPPGAAEPDAAVPSPAGPGEGWPVAPLWRESRAAGPEVGVTAGAPVGVPGEAGETAATAVETGVPDAVPAGETAPAPESPPVAAPPAPPGFGANAESRYLPTSPAQAVVVLRARRISSARDRSPRR